MFFWCAIDLNYIGEKEDTALPKLRNHCQNKLDALIALKRKVWVFTFRVNGAFK